MDKHKVGLEDILIYYVDECRKSARWIRDESNDNSIVIAVDRLSYPDASNEDDLVAGIRHASEVLESLRKMERIFHKRFMEESKEVLRAQ